MSNATKMDVLAACAGLKRADAAAFKNLLRELNVAAWSEIKENDYGKAVAKCQAVIGTISMTGAETIAELSDEPKLSVRDTLNTAALANNAKSEPGAGISEDIALTINSAPDLATGFERASKALFARNANRANAEAAAK